MHSSVQWSIISNSQNVEAAWVFIDKWMGEDVLCIYIHNRILLLSHFFKKRSLAIYDSMDKSRGYYA